MYQYIPKVREGIVDTFYSDVGRKITRDHKPDIEFLEHMKQYNPEIISNIRKYIAVVSAQDTFTQDETYKIMMSCLVSTLKMINAELEIRDLEGV